MLNAFFGGVDRVPFSYVSTTSEIVSDEATPDEAPTFAPPLSQFPPTFHRWSSRAFRGRRRLGRGGRIHLDRRPISRAPLPPVSYVTPVDELSDELLPSTDTESKLSESNEKVDSQILVQPLSESAPVLSEYNVPPPVRIAPYGDLLSDPMDIDALINAPPAGTMPASPGDLDRPELSHIDTDLATTDGALDAFVDSTQLSVTAPPPVNIPVPTFPNRTVKRWNLPNWKLFRYSRVD